MAVGAGLRRRSVLGAAALPLFGCQSQDRAIEGGFAGTHPERGHLMRSGAPASPAPTLRRTQVLIAGAGVAGLAAARALRQSGIEDFVLLDLEDDAGGNSRAGAIAGLACPLGAHYLPLPGDDAPHVQALLEELGLRRREAGRWVYDERHLCHSPQERLFFQGRWQAGLLPVEGVGAQTLAQYRSFAREVAQARRAAHFPLPVARNALAASHRALDAQRFSQWLDVRGLSDPQLRWYLDYCCRDD
ncbi:MAG TPA: NAD(P)-binding protein, partial [Ramlibacter sp.]|nr:NAD(P)-binding protein [Ramlibacter sp.]